MFVGHFALGLAAIRLEPRLSLGTTFAACQALDLLWPLFAIAGWETARVDHHATAFTPFDFVHYPWSHSLGMACVWAALAYATVWIATRTSRPAAVVAALVLSHWFLDWLTHRPDMPLWFGDTPKLGLGLWHSVPATLAVEGTMFAGSVALYASTVKRQGMHHHRGFIALIAFLAAMYLLSAFGPKPPDSMSSVAIAAPALSMWLVVAWAAAVDRRRTSAL